MHFIINSFSKELLQLPFRNRTDSFSLRYIVSMKEVGSLQVKKKTKNKCNKIDRRSQFFAEIKILILAYFKKAVLRGFHTV